MNAESWLVYDPTSATVDNHVMQALCGGDSDWRHLLVLTGMFDMIVDAYRDAINAVLPDGVRLAGDLFIHSNDKLADPLDYAALIDPVDLYQIVSSFDPDRSDVTLTMRVQFDSVEQADAVCSAILHDAGRNAGGTCTDGTAVVFAEDHVRHLAGRTEDEDHYLDRQGGETLMWVGGTSYPATFTRVGNCPA